MYSLSLEMCIQYLYGEHCINLLLKNKNKALIETSDSYPPIAMPLMPFQGICTYCFL